MLTVEAKVIDGVMTSSPGPMPRAMSARCIPAVAETTETACRAPVRVWNRSSKVLHKGTGRNPLRFQACGHSRNLRLSDGRPVQRQKIFSDLHHGIMPFSGSFQLYQIVCIIMPQDRSERELLFSVFPSYHRSPWHSRSLLFPNQTEKGIGGEKIALPLLARKLLAAVPHLSDVVDDRGPHPGIEIDPVKGHAVLIEQWRRREDGS